VIENDQRGRERHLFSQCVSEFTLEGGDRHKVAYYEETPTKVLEREYLIGSFGIATDGVFRVHPFEQLLSQSINQSFLNTFKYLRADLKLRLVTNCTISDVGVIVVSWFPDVANITMNYLSEYNSDPTLVDLSTQQMIEWTIPWTSTQEFIDLESTVVGKFIRVIFTTLYANNIGGADAPVARIYASFVNPQAVGSRFRTEPAVGVAQMNSKTDFMTALSTVAILGQAVGTGLSSQYGDDILWSMEEAAANDSARTSNRFMQTPAPGDHKEVETPNPVRMQSFGNLAGCVGDYTLTTHSHRPACVSPFHVGDDQFRHSISRIVRTPVITQAELIVPDLVYVIGVFPGDSVERNCTYADLWSSFFRFYRGGMNVRLSFFGSPLQSFQVVVSLSNDLNEESGFPISNYREVINIRGTQHHDIHVPFIATSQWLPTPFFDGAEIIPARLMVQVTIDGHAFGAESATLFMVVSVAAGEDFQFKDLRSWNAPNQVVPDPVEEFVPRGEAQMNLRSSFSGEFKNFTGAGRPVKLRPVFEDGLTAEDICLRYSSRNHVEPRLDAHTDLTNIHPPTSPLYWMDNFDAIVNMFRYVRGSVKFKFRPLNNLDGFMTAEVFSGGYRLVAAPVPHYPSHLGGDGIVSNHSSQNRVLEVEFPYMSTVDWKPIARMGTFGVQIDVEPYPLLTDPDVTSDVFYDFYYVAAGSDFQVAWLLPPPNSIERANPRGLAYS